MRRKDWELIKRYIHAKLIGDEGLADKIDDEMNAECYGSLEWGRRLKEKIK